jgi:hypothetical protein
VTVDYVTLFVRLGPAPRCLVCDRPIHQSDFHAGLVTTLSGQQRDYAAHILHFFTANGKATTDYGANLDTFTRRFAELEGMT